MRLAWGAAVVAWAMLPVSVLAVPSPSPSLDRILVTPPSGYFAYTTSPYHGPFTAPEFAATWGADSASGESQLHSDGFVDGYGLMWLQQSTGRFLAEFVIAFQGGNGAESFLGSEKVENSANRHFQHADSVDGIGPLYFGVHGASSSPAQVLDSFEFVRGNDLLGIALWSPKDDVLDLARAQTKRQYDAAPASTIPPEQWPENARSTGTAGDSSGNLGQAVIAGVIIIAAFLAGGAYMLMRRAENPVRTAPAPPELSPDGQYWWNGSGWVANTEAAPPWAQRSPDGAYWWDGHGWQPVPGNIPSPPALR